MNKVKRKLRPGEKSRRIRDLITEALWSDRWGTGECGKWVWSQKAPRKLAKSLRHEEMGPKERSV